MSYIGAMKATTIDDFYSRLSLNTDSGCLIYSGETCLGYGRFTHNGRRYQAHRFAYELARGPIPSGLVIDHLCRVKACCNPDHLDAVTQRTNVLRGFTVPAKHAAKTHCPHGHPYDQENTITIKRNGHHKRICRKCKNAAERLRRSGTPNPYRHLHDASTALIPQFRRRDRSF